MKDFQLQGINHIALVCKDMARTVEFYTNTLDLNLINGILLEFAANVRQLGDPVRDLQYQSAT